MSGVASVAVEWFHTTRDAGVVVGARDLVKMYGSGEARVVSLGVGRGRFRGGRITTDNPTHHHAHRSAPAAPTAGPSPDPTGPAPAGDFQATIPVPTRRPTTRGDRPQPPAGPSQTRGVR